MLLNEIFDFKIENIKKKDGTTIPIAYIDNKTSESVYPHKDKLKSKFGAMWDSINKRWFWWLSPDESKRDYIINNKVNPAIEYLVSVEQPKGGEEPRNSDSVKQTLQTLLNDIDKVLSGPTNGDSSKINDVKDKLQQFKDELVATLDDGDFKKLLEPIIKFRKAKSYEFSLVNTILIWLQDKEATLVKSKSKWKYFNREVDPNTPEKNIIALWAPVMINNVSKEEIAQRKANFLKQVNKKTVKDLEPHEREQLDIILKKGSVTKFVLAPNFYDVRFTIQMSDKEDLVGSNNDIEWFDEKTPENEKTVAIYDATIEAIQSTGIKLEYSDDLGGARGVSKNGVISVLKDTPKNAGTDSTLIHEFAHELLHQTYIKTQREEFAEYFVGTQEGRGVVEQQAELVAWIVLKHFDIDAPTNLNYMALWGIDANKASRVFDTVANTATKIYKLITQFLPMQLEGSTNLMEITGLELAQMLGDDAVNLYNQSKTNEAAIRRFNQLI